MGDRTGLQCLTLWQPWASLVTLGVKTIETRSWAAPEHLIGQRIGIHAAARRPAHMTKVGRFGVCRKGDGTTVMYDEVECIRSGVDQHVDLPLGALLGTVRLAACIPMVERCDGAPTPHLCFTGDDILLHSPLDEPWPSGQTEHIRTAQLPYGDFAPGRWAWLLEDPQPTTAQCPWCEGRRSVEFTPVPPAMGGSRPCHLCGGAGRCDPIPARGRQRVWYWTPDQGKDEAA